METSTEFLERASITPLQKRTNIPNFKNAVLEASLVGPRADLWLIGGASIVLCILYWLFVDSAASTTTIAFLTYYLGFVVNYPHFLSSYQLLYGDYRKSILKKKSYFWAAVIAPTLIAGSLIYAVLSANSAVLIFMAQAMFLSVGWHYVKQIYGVSLLASVIQKRYFGKWERNFILLNLFSVWALSWISANLGLRKTDLDGLKYLTLDLPSWMLTAAYVSTAITLAAAVATMLRKYVKTGVRPAVTSLVGFASIYFWYLPILNHPVFFYLIPFFHSLQYLMFVYALKRNQAVKVGEQTFQPEKQRKLFVKKVFGFFALAAILGALAFELIPNGLDAIIPGQNAILTFPVWYFAASLFINLHHYFIDNVIWRGDNEALKIYLIQGSQRRVGANA